MINGEELVKNIETCTGHTLAEEKGIFIIDFGAYFPFCNQEILKLDCSIGTDEAILSSENKKLNHRYPNKGYVTLSKKCGKHVCYSGYFWEQDIDFLNSIKHITFSFGAQGQIVNLTVPTTLSLDRNYPYTAIDCNVDLEDVENDINVDITAYHPDLDMNGKCASWTPKIYSTTKKPKGTDFEALIPDANFSSKIDKTIVFTNKIILPKQSCKSVFVS